MPIVPTTPEQPAGGLTAVPLFHAAWLFAAGIALAGHVWLQPSVVLIAFALTGVVCVVAALRAQRIAWLPLAALWMLLGAWCGEMEPHPAPAPALAQFSDGLLRNVEGTVIDAGPMRTELEQNVGESSTASPSQRIDLRVESIEVVSDSSDVQSPVSGGVRLTVRFLANTGAQAFQCGERIRAVVRLLPPETYHDPGVWSRADYLLDQGITLTATVASDRVERLGRAPGAFVPCRVHAWQHASTARLLALPAAMRGFPAPLRLSEDDAVMLSAMVAGDRTYLTHALRVGFERTGSFHMLVVSGLHLAIVAACLFWVFKRLRLPRVPATLLTIAASFAYALFTGFATPVQRSLWMVTLYLVGRLIYRERSPLNTIGFAALCLLVVSPRSLFDSSLQMTLLAVIAVAGVAAPLARGHDPSLRRRHARPEAGCDRHQAPAKTGAVSRADAHDRRAAATRIESSYCMARFSLDPAVRHSRARTGGGFLRRRASDDAAHGRLLPSHHHLRFAGESADCAIADRAHAGGARYLTPADGVARGCRGSGDGGCIS